MTLPDNRLRFDTTLIDFATDVGLEGQLHEDFPAASIQPRWDWLLMWFLALLANQSSDEEPTQYREGSLWMDLDKNVLRIRHLDAWASIADVIAVAEVTGTEGVTTLSQWFTDVTETLNSSAPESTFSGTSSQDDIATIPIPDELQTSLDVNKNKPFLWINGLLVDPRNVEFCTTKTIVLKNGITIDEGDVFTVLIKNITNQLFHVPSVVL
jgi:hypothetical protein